MPSGDEGDEGEPDSGELERRVDEEGSLPAEGLPTADETGVTALPWAGPLASDVAGEPSSASVPRAGASHRASSGRTAADRDPVAADGGPVQARELPEGGDPASTRDLPTTDGSASAPDSPRAGGSAAALDSPRAGGSAAAQDSPRASAGLTAPDSDRPRLSAAQQPSACPEGPSAAPHASPQPPSEPRAPQPPYIPRTMASPSRDGDLRRTFPALPTQDGPFARTWWGEAWIGALEGGALDGGRLLRGRGYAQEGRVDAITVTPGSVLAYVQGGRARPYRVQVRLRTWAEDDWERFVGAAVERPGQIAALLDREVPPALAAECGVPLLPVAGELEPQCSCPDRGHPCKHAAALCYQTARLLDADPFVLLLLRGRGERDLLDTLARRSAAHAARAARDGEAEDLPGVRAAEAIVRRGQLPPPPAPLPVPPHPEQPPAYPSVPGGPDAFALDQLATDAAARAHALLATGEDPVGGFTLWQDAVRLAAARPGSGLTAATRALYSSLATATGRTSGDLARAVAAWRQGGLDGLAVLEDPWDPPAGRFDRARPLLLSTGRPAFRPWRNHLTHPAGHIQLRYGQDGLWYAYESEPGDEDWWPRGTPAYDPIDALTTVDPREER
ncbi:SWIM zinc finger family protein [Streptomyces sp. 4F14]|uniref:SWIM zinc finger family protein n=1 Tax=Streptomyces sp. 4F14 TaxID=3394380 RepID=UPI003A87BB75